VNGCHDGPHGGARAESGVREVAPGPATARDGARGGVSLGRAATGPDEQTSTGRDLEARADLPVVALVGRPNVGKSTLFARVTSRYAGSANAPGTTVGADWRRVSAHGRDSWLVDLPGTLSLQDRPTSGDPAWALLLDVAPDAILVVVDATDVGRHIPLALACRDLGLPVVVAVNLSDEADRLRVTVDTGRLSQLLVAPVFTTSGRTGAGVDAALAAAVRLATQRRAFRAGLASPRGTVPAGLYGPQLELELDRVARRLREGASLGAAVLDPTGVGDYLHRSLLSPRGAASIELSGRLEPLRWQLGNRWAGQVVTDGRDSRRTETRGELLARLSTQAWPGLPIFAALVVGTLLVMMAVGGLLSAVLAAAWAATASPLLAVAVPAIVPQPLIAHTLLWALDGGVLAVLTVGIPYVLTFYVLLAVLEDSGYLTTTAVLTDRLFNALGLPGRAAIPLIAATGCNVPAIYGTRVLATRRERLLASFLATMTPCSARSAVIVGALAPFVGPMAALAAFGVVALLTVAGGVAANAMIPGRQPPLVLELTPLRRPVPALVAARAWHRFRAFVTEAAPFMLIGSLVLGFVYESGLVWPLATVTDPVVRNWLGLPSVAGLALVFGFLRKELALQLLVALAIVQFGPQASNLGRFMSPAQLFVYAVVVSVSVPCIATFAALRAEHGWRPALAMSAGSLGIALGAGGVLARVLGAA